MSSRTLILVLLLLVGVPAPATATPFDDRPKILLHRTGVTTKNQCLATGISDCSSAQTAAGLNEPSFVYVLVAPGNVPSVGGAGFAIEYEDNCPEDLSNGSRIDIYSWDSCSDSQIGSGAPDWPEPRSGMILHWLGAVGCQTAPLIIGGYFYLSASAQDTLHVTRNHPNPGIAASLSDCEFNEYHLDQSDLGSVVFAPGGAISGCNPCEGPCPDPLPAPGPDNCDSEPPPPPPPPPASYGPKLLLHIGDVVAKNPCGSGLLGRCDEATTSAGLSTPKGPFYFVYLLAAPGSADSVAGLVVGIDYENGQVGDESNGTGIDIFGWFKCTTAEYVLTTPNPWPAPRGGNLLIWDYIAQCQTGATGVAGYFYVGAYSPDRFRLIPEVANNRAQVATCSIHEINLAPGDLGFVEFSDGAKARGCNPCLVDCSAGVNVRPTSWSRIKTLIGK